MESSFRNLRNFFSNSTKVSLKVSPIISPRISSRIAPQRNFLRVFFFNQVLLPRFPTNCNIFFSIFITGHHPKDSTRNFPMVSEINSCQWFSSKLEVFFSWDYTRNLARESRDFSMIKYRKKFSQVFHQVRFSGIPLGRNSVGSYFKHSTMNFSGEYTGNSLRDAILHWILIQKFPKFQIFFLKLFFQEIVGDFDRN